MTSLDFPNKPILFVDEFGNESPQAAKLVMDKGIKDVSILFDGMDSWVDYITNSEIEIKSIAGWAQNERHYDLISGNQFASMLKSTPVTVIDVRTREEFSNSSKNYWQNIGQVKGALNIPANEIKTSSALPQSKNSQIVLYGFNSQPEIFEAARWLQDQGYKNVDVLQGGIWRLRWVSHNIKGNEQLNDLVVNVPPDNQ